MRKNVFLGDKYNLYNKANYFCTFSLLILIPLEMVGISLFFFPAKLDLLFYVCVAFSFYHFNIENKFQKYM